MLNGGEWLDSQDAWDRWPAALPLLCYHGGEDNICDVRATKRFVEGVKAGDKTIKVFEVSFFLSLRSVVQEREKGLTERYLRACTTKYTTRRNRHRATLQRSFPNGLMLGSASPAGRNLRHLLPGNPDCKNRVWHG